VTARPLRQPAPLEAGSDGWLPPARRAGRGTPLVCLPPAGAGAGFFRSWGAALPGRRIVPAQLPGREERYGEPLIADARAIARAVAGAILAEGWPAVALAGYSFGALLAFEAAAALEADGRCRVEVVVACARGAPQSAPRDSAAEWPDADLLAYIRDLGGLPPEVLAEPAFLDLLLPVLRADLRANDRYAAAPAHRIVAPIVSIAGTDDAASGDAREAAWGGRTHGAHQLHLVPGGHFFINENPGAAFATIASALPASHTVGATC
jgi:surfactin synthase thioesterase subunit